ncbi:MAG: hypothetical protein ABIR56_20050, partial [Polaromonas sp.]
SARCVIRKKPYEVWQGCRECKLGDHNAEMIADSSLGSNRISMQSTSTRDDLNGGILPDGYQRQSPVHARSLATTLRSTVSR